MFLYDKKENTLDVYKFTGNNDKLINYRKEQLRKNQKDLCLLYAQTTARWQSLLPPLFEEYQNDFDTTIFTKRMVDGYTHHLISVPINESIKETYKQFCNGKQADKPIIRVAESNDISYFLLTNQKYQPDGVYKEKLTLSGIIRLPESLFILQMLEQGKFSVVRDYDISEQLRLFSFTKVGQLDIEQLKNMDICGISQNAYTETLAKAEAHKEGLQLIKTKFN